MIPLKAFTIVITQENRLRFRMLKKEHGLLHDQGEKKSYAVVRDAYPTNWAGRFSRVYLVHENAAQTIELEGGRIEAQGATVAIEEPLNMVARVRIGSRRGIEGGERDVHLTAETIFDRTESVQVRRLGNRRFQWFHALLFVALGVTIGLFVAGAMAVMGGGDAAPEEAEPTSPRPQIQASPAPVPQVTLGAAATPQPTLDPAR